MLEGREGGKLTNPDLEKGWGIFSKVDRVRRYASFKYHVGIVLAYVHNVLQLDMICSAECFQLLLRLYSICELSVDPLFQGNMPSK